MPNDVTKAALTPARKRLVELMQEVNYGRIEELRVENGEPVFDPRPQCCGCSCSARITGRTSSAAATGSP